MASLTQQIWVWASFGRWRWTGKPGVLQSAGLKGIRHDLVTEQQQSGKVPQFYWNFMIYWISWNVFLSPITLKISGLQDNFSKQNLYERKAFCDRWQDMKKQPYNQVLWCGHKAPWTQSKQTLQTLKSLPQLRAMSKIICVLLKGN